MKSFETLIKNRFDVLEKDNDVLSVWAYYTDLFYPLILEKKAVIITITIGDEQVGGALCFLSEDTLFYAITTFNSDYNKFNLGFKDIANNGFMSFDINVEGLLMPNKPFSPFVFAGVGLNASNYFKQSDIKTQMGFGIEYIVTRRLGLKLFTDYNYVFSDLVDGKEFGSSDDAFWRIGFGINYYFRDAKKKKESISGPSIINSNPIIHNN